MSASPDPPPSSTVETPTTGQKPRRERELYRYAEALEDIHPTEAGKVSVSSRDASLTAYAQLVALRLNVKRAVISLFDKYNHFIIAEATQTLSLQNDIVHDAADELCFGTTVFRREDDFYRATMKQRKARDEGTANAPFLVPDLRQDERYSEHDMVVRKPFAVAYGGVSLITPSGYAVGTLSFLDDKPMMDGLTTVQSQFMRDIASTIVTHLEMARITKAHSRGLRMVQALSRFVEGKDSVEEDTRHPYRDPEDRQERQQAQTAGLEASTRTMAFNATGNAERMDAMLKERFGSGLARPQALVESSNSTHSKENVPERAQHSGDDQPPDAGLQEGLLSQGVRKCFGRAASMINDALDLSGTIFLDASVGEHGRLRSPSDTSRSPAGRSASDVQPSDTDTSGERSQRKRRAPAEDKPVTAQKPSRQLASVYNDRWINKKPGVVHRGVPEHYLKSLMRRYPYGNIWHFDQDGQTSAGESSDSGLVSATEAASTQPDNGKERRKRRRRGRDDGLELLKLFPGVRAMLIMPMWDAKRERFFACTVGWTYSATRTLSFQDDLGYLCAFCDVLMGEVARLDTRRELDFKTGFMSTMSHELRSPLHGIIGGVECLQDKPDAAVQDEVLQMIAASGKSLLDIVNHLLDFARAPSRTKPASRRSSGIHTHVGLEKRPVRRYRSADQPTLDLAGITEETLNTLLWATPQPAQPSNPGDVMRGDVPLKVMLELDSTNLDGNDWHFRANADAWKRILQNLVNNSIKYTDLGGYLKVVLSTEPYDSANSTTTVVLTCADSGRGMTKDYLNYGLWEHFSQEDSHVKGTGLGLRLVSDIVRDMEGSIDVQSRKNVGTTVKVSVPLVQGELIPSTPENEVKQLAIEPFSGYSFTLSGFERGTEDDERTSAAISHMRASILRSCEALGMRKAEEESAEVCIVPEEHIRGLLLLDEPAESILALGQSVIVLCHSTASMRAFVTAQGASAVNGAVVSQPLGPRKLSRALAACRRRTTPSASHLNVTADEQSLRACETEEDATSHAVLSPRTSERLGEWTADGLSDRSRTSRSRPRTSPGSRENGAANGLASTVPQMKGPPVLLVEDNHLNLVLLQAYMRKLKRLFTSAINGQEAVNAYTLAHDQYRADSSAPAPPTMILMDITMPVMDGLQATRQIRAYERRHDLKSASIIAVTAMGTPQARHEAFGSGVDLFMTKPVRLNELTEIMEQGGLDNRS